ncbi:hypothetical protein JZ751_020920 [Albula glossodonta]|uniref:Uncharacterized protein n=1 Tax=Albula glossodonta TaxID=121402 RepID=A0A8T2PKS7_9TELE|nr:hypothetical protein JZ751_020920 [Albula glossodonta]
MGGDPPLEMLSSGRGRGVCSTEQSREMLSSGSASPKAGVAWRAAGQWTLSVIFPLSFETLRLRAITLHISNRCRPGCDERLM